MGYAIQKIGYDLTRSWNAGDTNRLTNPGNAYTSPNSLVGWWRMDKDVTSSGDVTDSSGLGRPGTFAAAANRPAFSDTGPITLPLRRAYIQDNSCLFDGTDDAVNIGTATTWDDIIGNDTDAGSTEKMTFSAWVNKAGDGGGGSGRILDFGSGDLLLYTDTSERIYFHAKWDGNNVVTWRTEAGSFSMNTWTHITLTYNATDSNSDPKIYVDGIPMSVEHASGTKTGSYYGIVSQDGFIGNSSTEAHSWEGQLADIAIWNSILTAEEAAALYTINYSGAYLVTRDYSRRGSVATLSGSIDQFRQGVSIQSMTQRYAGLSPKISAGSAPLTVINGKLVKFQDKIFDETNQPPRIAKIISGSTLAALSGSTNPLNSARGIVSFIPNHHIERRDYGQPKLFKDDEPYEDMADWNPVDFMFDCGDSIIYPYIYTNVSMKDPDQMDGVIEPLAIRSRASRNSIDWPYEAHSIWGLWMDGAEDSRRSACAIVQTIDLEPTSFEPFEDGGFEFMGFKPSAEAILSGSLQYGAIVSNYGYLHDVPAVINPWVETTDRELYFSPLIKSGSFINQPDHKAREVFDAILASNTSDKASSIDDLTERHHKSAPAGYDYLGAEDGTDSIAFGGLKK